MMPEKWTNRSRPPSSGVMKPNPLSSENHLTVPDAITSSSPLLAGLFCPIDDRPVLVGPDADNAICGDYQSARAPRPDDRPESLRQFGRCGRDGIAVAGLRNPRQPQRIALVARDHVQVEVEDR